MKNNKNLFLFLSVVIFFFLYSFNIYSQTKEWVKIEDFKKYSDRDAKKYLDKMIQLDPGYSKIYRYILILKSDQKKYFEYWDQILNSKSRELQYLYLANSFITNFFLNRSVKIDYFYEFGFQYLPDDEKTLFYALYKTFTMNFYSETKQENFEEIILEYLKKVDGLLNYVIKNLSSNENLINVIIKNGDKINLKDYNNDLKIIFKNAKNFFLIESFINYFNKYDKNYVIDSLYYLLSHKDINVNIFALELSVKINVFEKLKPESYKKILYNNDIGFVVSIFSRLLTIKPGNKKLEDILFQRYNSLPDSLKASFIPVFYNFVHLEQFSFFLNSYSKTTDDNLKLELKKLLVNYINSKKYNKENLIYFLKGIRDYDEPFFANIAYDFLFSNDIEVINESLSYFYYNYDEENKDFNKKFKQKLLELIFKEEDERFLNIWFQVVSTNNLKDIYTKSFDEFFPKLKTTEKNRKLYYYIKYIEYFQTPQIFITIINSKLTLDKDSIQMLNSIMKRNIKLFNDELIESFFVLLKKHKSADLLNDYLIFNDRITLICLKVIEDYKNEIFIPNLIYLLQKGEKISNKSCDILLQYNLNPYYDKIFNIFLYENYNYLRSIIKIINRKVVSDLKYLSSLVYLLNYHINDDFYNLIKEFFLSYFKNYNTIKDDKFFYNFEKVGKNSIEILNESLLIFKEKKDYKKVLVILEILTKFKDSSSANYFSKLFDIEDKKILKLVLDNLAFYNCELMLDDLIKIYNDNKDDYFLKQSVLKVINNSYDQKVKDFVIKITESESIEIKKLSYEIIKNNGNNEYIDYLLLKINEKYSYEALQGIFSRESFEVKEYIKDKFLNNKIDFYLFLIDGIKKGNINPKDNYTLNFLLKNYEKTQNYIYYEKEEELKNLIPLILSSDVIDEHFAKINNLFSFRKELIDLLSFGIASNNLEKQVFSRNLIINYKYKNIKETLNFLKFYNINNYNKFSYLIAFDKDFNKDSLLEFIKSESKLNINNLVLILNFSDPADDILIELSNFYEYFILLNKNFINRLNIDTKNMIFNNLVNKGDLNNIKFLYYLNENFNDCLLSSDNFFYIIESYLNSKKNKDNVKEYKGKMYILENIILNNLNFQIENDKSIVKNGKVKSFFEKYIEENKNSKNFVYNSLLKLSDFRFAEFFKNLKEDIALLSSSLLTEQTQSIIMYFNISYQENFYSSLERINKIKVNKVDDEFIINLIKNTKKIENITLLLTKFDIDIFENYIFRDDFFNKLNKEQVLSIFLSYQKMIDYDLKNSNFKLLIFLNNYYFDEIFVYSYIKKFKKVDPILYNKIIDFINNNKLEKIRKFINILLK